MVSSGMFTADEYVSCISDEAGMLAPTSAVVIAIVALSMILYSGP